MSMRTYWLKIAGGALAIFAVGFAGISAMRAGKREVVRVVESASDVTIPLPFVPFNFDGERAGNFRKATFHRSTPNTVSGVDITIRLADPGFLTRFENCPVTLDDPTRLSERSSFRCATADADMQNFGTIAIEVKGEGGSWATARELPLVLAQSAIAELHGKGIGTGRRDAARYEARRFRQLGDSIRILGRELGRAESEAERQEITAQINALQTQLSEMGSAIAEAAAERGAEAVREALESVPQVVKVETKVQVATPQ